MNDCFVFREQPQNSLSFLSPRALVSILRLAPLQVCEAQPLGRSLTRIPIQEVHLLSCFSSHSSVEELKAESTTLLAEKLQQVLIIVCWSVPHHDDDRHVFRLSTSC